MSERALESTVLIPPTSSRSHTPRSARRAGQLSARRRQNANGINFQTSEAGHHHGHGGHHHGESAKPGTPIYYLKRSKTYLILGFLIAALALFSSQKVTSVGELPMFGLSASQSLLIPLNYDGVKTIAELHVEVAEGHEEKGNITVFLQAAFQSPAEEWQYTDDQIWVIDFANVPSNGKLEPRFIPVPRQDDKLPQALQLSLTTDSHAVVVIGLRYIMQTDLVNYRILFAALVLVSVYVLIIFELVHRTVAAMFGSFCTLGLLSLFGNRPSIEVIVSWLEFDTLMLLFGMMFMVSIFSKTGFFEWCALQAYKISKGNAWRLVTILMIFSAVVSSFLDNVTTVVLLVPIVIRLCKVLEIDPVPVLISTCLFSNIGGTATAVGDPPAVMIVSSADLRTSGVSFLLFTVRMLPGSVLAAVACYYYIAWVYKPKVSQEKPNINPDRVSITKEIEIWKDTMKRLTGSEPEEDNVRLMLEDHIAELQEELMETERDSKQGQGIVDMSQLEESCQITNVPLFTKCCIVLTAVILMFFLQPILQLELQLAWIAIFGAVVLFVLSEIKDIEEVLTKIDFGTLLFFAALFVLMEGLGDLGLIGFIGNATANVIAGVPESSRLAVSIVLILWISAIVSAFIDNIPFTAAMIPVVIKLAESPELNLPLYPLVWALGFGTCLGGNGTLIGASANVVTAGLSEQNGHPIKFGTFFRVGFPVMIISVFVSMFYLLVLNVWAGVDQHTAVSHSGH